MSDDHDEDATATITAKVDTDYLDKLQKLKEAKTKKVDASQQLKRKTGGLSLESTESVAERKRRDKSEEELEKERAEEASKMRIATYAQRVQAGAVDLAVMLGLCKVSSMEKLTYYTEEYFFKVQDAAGIQLELSDTVLDYILFGINFCALYFFVQVCLTWLTQKSIGKMVFKTHLVSFDADKVGLFQAIKREAILKPLGVVFLVGFIMPFFSEDTESFHDRFGGTLVAKDK